MLEDDVVGRVFAGADFLQDDVLLAGEIVRIERRLGQNIRQHVERERHVRLQHARIIGRCLDAGRRIEIAADGFDLLGDIARGAPLGALERHVFEKVRNAVFFRRLVAAAGADPDAERRRFQMRHRIGDDHEPGRQTGKLDTHAAAPCAARLTPAINFSTAA